jgi:hypothetical protein
MDHLFCDTPATFHDTPPHPDTAMNSIFRNVGKKCSVAWTAGLAALLCLGLAGCSRVNNLRGDAFQDNSMGEAVRESQPPSKKPQEFWSFSNKARQIEADFPDH